MLSFGGYYRRLPCSWKSKEAPWTAWKRRKHSPGWKTQLFRMWIAGSRTNDLVQFAIHLMKSVGINFTNSMTIPKPRPVFLWRIFGEAEQYSVTLLQHCICQCGDNCLSHEVHHPTSNNLTSWTSGKQIQQIPRLLFLAGYPLKSLTTAKYKTG